MMPFFNSAFAVLFNLLFVAGVVFVCFYIYSRSTKVPDSDASLEEDEETLEEPLLEEALVLSKRVYVNKTGGYKSFKHRTGFTVTFSLSSGRTVEYEVPCELFEKITEGDSGMLMTQNGNFLDFGDGTDID